MKWLRISLGTLFLLALLVSCADLLSKRASNPELIESTPPEVDPTLLTSQPEATQSILKTIEATPEINPVVASQVSPRQSTSSPTATRTVPPPPLATPTPTRSKSASPTTTLSNSSNKTPTFTPTLMIPNAAIQIADPGPLSRIISPLNMVATIHTVPGGSFHVELWAEPLVPDGDPRLLLREVNNFVAEPFPWLYLNKALEFELSRVSELGILRILTYDKYGRTVAAASVEVVLLQYGENQLTPQGDDLESLVILDPTPNILIQGGSLIIAGLARPLDSQPLLVELVAADGSVKGVQQIFLTPAPDGGYLPFAAEVAYSVSSPTWVRLIISQTGIRIPGVRMLNSLEVLLSP